MTSILDLMALAKRTLERGETELAAQMSVLALESASEEDVVDPKVEQQKDSDLEELDGTMLDALENGTNNDGIPNQVGMGETPVAMALELAYLTKQLRDSGFKAEAHSLNSVIEILTRSEQ